MHSYIVSLESYLQRHLHSYSNKDIDHEEHSNTFWRSHASPCMGHKTEENAWITHLNFDLKIILMTRALHNIFNTPGFWQIQCTTYNINLAAVISHLCDPSFHYFFFLHLGKQWSTWKLPHNIMKNYKIQMKPIIDNKTNTDQQNDLFNTFTLRSY